MPITGFEPRYSGIGGDLGINCATTNAQPILGLMLTYFIEGNITVPIADWPSVLLIWIQLICLGKIVNCWTQISCKVKLQHKR